MYFMRQENGNPDLKKIVYSLALLCQLAALVLELLPNAVKAPFASGPHQWVTESFSYFDLALPFGAVVFSPFLTGVMTIVVIIHCLIILLKKKTVPRLCNVAFTLTIATASFAVMALFEHGIYRSVTNYAVSALILISICLQTVANRHLTTHP